MDYYRPLRLFLSLLDFPEFTRLLKVPWGFHFLGLDVGNLNQLCGYGRRGRAAKAAAVADDVRAVHVRFGEQRDGGGAAGRRRAAAHHRVQYQPGRQHHAAPAHRRLRLGRRPLQPAPPDARQPENPVSAPPWHGKTQ